MVKQLLALLAMAALNVACPYTEEEPPPPAPRFSRMVEPARYAVLAPMNPHGYVGDTIQMGANVVDHGQTISWKCSYESLQPSVASIDQEGRLTVRGEGSATIRATCDGMTVGTTGSFSRRPT